MKINHKYKFWCLPITFYGLDILQVIIDLLWILQHSLDCVYGWFLLLILLV